jgi:hypothetical protein
MLPPSLALQSPEWSLGLQALAQVQRKAVAVAAIVTARTPSQHVPDRWCATIAVVEIEGDLPGELPLDACRSF